jgi:hypothetical protein
MTRGAVRHLALRLGSRCRQPRSGLDKEEGRRLVDPIVIEPRLKSEIRPTDDATFNVLFLCHSYSLKTLKRGAIHLSKMPAAPAPFHILRNHLSPLSALSINPSNTLLYTGDQDGNVGITDLSSRRVVRLWKAHKESILSVEEWNGHLIR